MILIHQDQGVLHGSSIACTDHLPRQKVRICDGCDCSDRMMIHEVIHEAQSHNQRAMNMNTCQGSTAAFHLCFDAKLQSIGQQQVCCT